MTSPARPSFFVHGIALVNTGGAEKCEACGHPRTIVRSLSGLGVCLRCSRDFDQAAQEMAAEAPR